MPGETPQEYGPDQGNANLIQVFSALPLNALSSQIPNALGYYRYALVDGEGMTEMAVNLKEKTPPLAALRDRLYQEFLPRAMADPLKKMSPEHAAELGSEFDITLLTIYYCRRLRTPLKALQPPNLMARKLNEGVTVANKVRPQQEMDRLQPRYPALWELSRALAQSALRRASGETPATADSKPVNFKNLSSDDRKRFMEMRFAQHAAIFSMVAGLDTLRP